MITFNNRFHGHNSLRYVYKNGEAVRSRSITFKFIQNKNRKRSRFAVVISKKILKSAVKRNLLRRRMYEYIRLKLPYLKDVYDVVFIITSNDLLNMSHDELVHQLDQLVSQSGILAAHKVDQK